MRERRETVPARRVGWGDEGLPLEIEFAAADDPAFRGEFGFIFVRRKETVLFPRSRDQDESCGEGGGEGGAGQPAERGLALCIGWIRFLSGGGGSLW